MFVCMMPHRLPAELADYVTHKDKMDVEIRANFCPQTSMAGPSLKTGRHRMEVAAQSHLEGGGQ